MAILSEPFFFIAACGDHDGSQAGQLISKNHKIFISIVLFSVRERLSSRIFGFFRIQ